MTIAVKQVAEMPCSNENEQNEVLHADLKGNVSPCLHNSFGRNQEQKGDVNLLPYCKQAEIAGTRKLGTARNSVDMLLKQVEDSDMGEQEREVMEQELKER